MTIEGLGKKFQEARRARNLTLDEAARMTKIRPARLAEIEADDFSQFPSLAYAKGFLLIYGKFLDVDVTPYLEVFEDSNRITGDGYSYLQENPAPKTASAPVLRSSNRDRISPMPLIIGVLVLVVGFSAMKLIVNLQRIAPRRGAPTAEASPSASAIPSPAATAEIAANTPAAASPSPSATVAPIATIAPTPTPVVAVSSPKATEPEVRRAQPVHPEDLASARAGVNSSSAESAGENRVAIRALKKTHVKVTVENKGRNTVFERWVSPGDGTMEFRGKRVSVHVLDPESVEIRKNGKALEEDDDDVTVE